MEPAGVAVAGAGRLGRLLARRLPGGTCRAIYTRRPEAAGDLATAVGAAAGAEPAVVRGCDVVLLALPPDAVAAALEAFRPHLAPGTLVVNMATQLETEPLRRRFPEWRVAAAKLVGHAREIEAGEIGAVVVDHAAPSEFALIRRLLGGLGPVLAGDEKLVLQVNTAVAEELLKALRGLERRLASLGVPEAVAAAALQGSAPGVLRSLAKNDLGPFLRSVVEREEAKA